MGNYDVRAFVNKVLEVTEEPKLTIIGYSQGSAQTIYAMAKDQDFYALRVHRFIALGACMAA